MTDHDQTHPIGWWRLCGRPLVAYCVASAAAGVTLGLFEILFTSGMRFDRGLTAGVMFGLFLAPFVGLLALIPSVIALTIAKTLQMPRGLTDTCAGGLIGAAMIALLSQLFFGGSRTAEEVVLEAARYGLAGLAGGYVYWLVNGRPHASKRSRRDAASLAGIEEVFD